MKWSLSSLYAVAAGAILLGVLLSFTGGVWDIQWHQDVGPDTFFTAPHLLLYSGAALVGLSSLAVVLTCTERARSAAVAADPAVVPVLWGTFRAPRAFVVSGCGAALFLLAGLYDQWWHRIYGFDAELASPPHSALGLADVTSLFGVVAVFALLMTRRTSAWPVLGLATGAAVFLANSASWQITLPLELAGVNLPLVFVAALYPVVLTAVASVARRTGAAALTGLAFTLLCAAVWLFSAWATPRYADSLGLFVRDDAPGLPEIVAVLPKFVLPAGLLVDGALAWARRTGRGVRSGTAVAGGLAALVLVAAEIPLLLGAVTQPPTRPVLTVIAAVAVGGFAGWAGWKLGVVLRSLAGPRAAAIRAGRGAGRLAITGTALALLLLAPISVAAAAPALPLVHREAVDVGAYLLEVGFSEWPMRAERSLDIVFQPEGGIAGLSGTVTLTAPSGEQEQRELVRHPRMREAWGLDIVALDEQGPWTLRFALDGPRGSGTGALPIDLGPRPGPPAALGSLPTLTAALAMGTALTLAWRRADPAHRPETTTWT